MPWSIRDNTKRRGRPKTTGPGVLIGVRLLKTLLGQLDRWIKAQLEPRPTRPEAIRQLLEKALATAPTKRRGAIDRVSRAARAEKIAGEQIDRALENIDQPQEEKARRKRRLIKGPPEFRR